MQDYIVINENDNVAVALRDIARGESFCGLTGVNEDVPRGHKFALRNIKKGEDVVKYGQPIGLATKDIAAGSHVHVHNLKTKLTERAEYSYAPVFGDTAPGETSDEDFFMGYLRKDGRAGVRNEVIVLPTVGCVNDIAKEIASKTGVKAYTHPYGCSQLGDDQENTRKVLAALAMHPNVGGVLILGLGCENSNVEVMKKYLGGMDKTRVRFLVCQETEDEVARGCELVYELKKRAIRDRRVNISTKKLVIGLKCGGSDGLSGITANPLVGAFADRLTAKGGSVILTEVPEMFGAEQLLMNRCENRDVFDRTVNMINSFKDYYARSGLPVYENPSPGNKAGGISTLEDKSLGCVQKAGTGVVRDVLMYGEQVKRTGLSLLSAPGNDLVASTALAAAGAQIVLFTTGRGTPFACPVPTVKISTNTSLYNKKKHWIDYNAGAIVEKASFADEVVRLYSYVMMVAGGYLTCQEEHGYADLAIFKNGVTL